MWQWTDGTEELYHYGVKGMKWGVRRQRNTTGKATTKKGTKKKGLSDGQKTALKIGAATAVAAGSAYVAYRIYKNGGIGNKKVSAVSGNSAKRAEQAAKISKLIDGYFDELAKNEENPGKDYYSKNAEIFKKMSRAKRHYADLKL